MIKLICLIHYKNNLKIKKSSRKPFYFKVMNYKINLKHLNSLKFRKIIIKATKTFKIIYKGPLFYKKNKLHCHGNSMSNLNKKELLAF